MATKSISLKDRWRLFGNIILDPWVLILLVASAAAGYLAGHQSDPKSIFLMTLIAAICGGILGGILTKRWSEMTDERVIIARGKTAVRGLHLLLNNIAYLEERTKLFLSRQDETAERSDEAWVAFEEIIGVCRVLEEEALNSIENWTDIIPEADVKTQIGMISRLQQLVESLQIDIGRLKSQAEESNKDKAEVAALRKAIQERESLLQVAQSKLLGSRITLGTSGPAGFSLDPDPALFVVNTGSKLNSVFRSCAKCGTGYMEFASLLGSAPISGILVKEPENLCLECKKKSR